MASSMNHISLSVLWWSHYFPTYLWRYLKGSGQLNELSFSFEHFFGNGPWSILTDVNNFPRLIFAPLNSRSRLDLESDMEEFSMALTNFFIQWGISPPRNIFLIWKQQMYKCNRKILWKDIFGNQVQKLLTIWCYLINNEPPFTKTRNNIQTPEA